MTLPEPLSVPPSDLAERARREVDLLAREIGEIELLVQQARTEASRHEQKRAQMAERLHALPATARDDEGAELVDQLLALTKRAAVMESQVDVLEGKLKVLTRFRESLERYKVELERAGPAVVPADGGEPRPLERLDPGAPLPPAISRVVLEAQEDLRREIARAMHDGPAQSLTNIVLQAQIVERLLDRDPAAVRPEIEQLVAMVQQTLDATKAFIFDVRPMVLDDLGLVPTLRRVARDRGRRSHVAIEFESFGADRRLPMDAETGLFRIIDESVTGFLGCRPDRITIRLDWSDGVEARVAARREPTAAGGDAAAESTPPSEDAPEAGGRRGGRGRNPDHELPAALRAMIEEQRAGAARAARRDASMALPPPTWREVRQRAEMIGARADLSEDGSELVLVLAGR